MNDKVKSVYSSYKTSLQSLKGLGVESTGDADYWAGKMQEVISNMKKASIYTLPDLIDLADLCSYEYGKARKAEEN